MVFCDLEDKNSNVRNWLQIRSARIPDLKKAVEAYNFDTDPLIQKLHDIGYDNFIKSTKIYTQNKVTDDMRKEVIEGWISKLNLGSMERSAKLFAEGSYSHFGFLDTVFGFTTIGDGNKTKMYVILGQKAGLWDKIGDYLLIDFTQEYELKGSYQ